MNLYGLIGYPLDHSFSEKYFSEKFERERILQARYELFPLENIAGLTDLLAQKKDLRGLNVTIPHKESIIPWLHELDETARAVGAVNCIKVIENQRLIGYNTDVTGFENSLLGRDVLQWKKEADTAMILGTGGASKAVAFVLKKHNIPYLFVSRTPRAENEISYENLLIQRSSFIVNTTPVGTYPRIEEIPPLPFTLLKPGVLVYDLVYNPAETLLLRVAKARGCSVKNGLQMLALQAEAAWQIWNSPTNL